MLELLQSLTGQVAKITGFSIGLADSMDMTTIAAVSTSQYVCRLRGPSTRSPSPIALYTPFFCGTRSATLFYCTLVRGGVL